MPTTNQYSAFATAGAANAVTPAAWAALTTLRANGFQPGVALSEQVNTALRQALTGVAGVATFATTFGSLDCLDDANAANFAAALKSAIDTLISSSQFWAPGDVKSTLNPTIPAGWLACNGALVSRVTYAALFTAIGTTYGAGDGTTTFKLPDLRGEFLRGLDGGRGVDPARVLGSTQEDMVEVHKHASSWGEAGAGPFGNTTNPGHFGSNAIDSDNYLWYTNDGSNVDGTLNPPGRIGNETRPRNVAVLYLIKT